MEQSSLKKLPTEPFTVITCRYRVDTKTASLGTLAYIMSIDLSNKADSKTYVMLLRRAGNGLWFKRWERVDKLSNFKRTTILPTNPLYQAILDNCGAKCLERLKASALAHAPDVVDACNSFLRRMIEKDKHGSNISEN